MQICNHFNNKVEKIVTLESKHRKFTLQGHALMCELRVAARHLRFRVAAANDLMMGMQPELMYKLIDLHVNYIKEISDTIQKQKPHKYSKQHKQH